MLNMLFHSVFQGVRIGQMPHASCTFPEVGKYPDLQGGTQRSAIILPRIAEGRIRSSLVILHGNYGPGSYTPLQRLTARAQMEMSENLSGKSPPSDAGHLPLHFVGS